MKQAIMQRTQIRLFRQPANVPDVISFVSSDKESAQVIGIRFSVFYFFFFIVYPFLIVRKPAAGNSGLNV